MWYCYILRNKNDEYKKFTYNGFTNNPFRRIRQHNGEIKGGAKYTKNKGEWEIYVLLTGFVDNHNALSCEWRIKHPTNKRTRPKKYCGIDGRVKSLNEVLILDKWTNQCTINNNICEYTLYIANDVAHLIEYDKIPRNVTIRKVDKISKETIKKFENESVNDIHDI